MAEDLTVARIGETHESARGDFTTSVYLSRQPTAQEVLVLDATLHVLGAHANISTGTEIVYVRTNTLEEFQDLEDVIRAITVPTIR